MTLKFAIRERIKQIKGKYIAFITDSRPMVQKIFFGDVEVLNHKTRERVTLTKRMYKEHDRPNDAELRESVLKHLKANDREHWHIERLCFDTAKYLGNTVN